MALPAASDPSSPPGRTASAWWPLAAVLVVSLATRLTVAPASHEGNMSPDAAHFLNVARCVARGEGFSNPAAWPAWLRPDRLPAPETFKEPGLPYAIAIATPLVRDPFLAGKWMSMVAGVLLPFAVYLLAWRTTRDRTVAWMAAMLAAASPVLIVQSVRVMAESLFVLLLTLAFAMAAPRGSPPPRRAAAGDLAAGALLGLAFLVRAQALLALAALAALAFAGRPGQPGRAGVARSARMLLAMLVVASPLLIRNLSRFGTPLYSDAASFAVWPFVDPLEFSHGLTRPPAPLPFALAHAPQLIAHGIDALERFARSALPRDLLGHVAWTPALAAGLVLGVARWRTWAFAFLYLVPVVLMMSAVSWNTRYFASTTPLWCLLTAAGAVWIARLVPSARRTPALRRVAAAAMLALIVIQKVRARQEVGLYRPAEIAAAAAEAPWLAGRLLRGESVMAVTTSYWSWFTDRPSIHLVIAGEAEFMAEVRRHRVRWAALPTSRLAEFAARYPGGRLPSALVPDHADPARDITVFAVRDDSPAAPAR